MVRLWSGLGYNRRALNLHRAAAAIVADHGGAVPHDDAALRALPGVGPYTARAVRTFAFGDDVAAVDTNGVRVLARAVAGAPLTLRQAMALGDRLVPAGAVVGVQPGDVRPRCHGVHGGHAPTARAARCAASAPGVVRATRGRRRPVAAEPDGAAAEHLRRIGPPGQGTAARRAAPRRRARRAVWRPPAAGPRTRRGPSGWPAAVVAEGFARWSGGKDPVLRLR